MTEQELKAWYQDSFLFVTEAFNWSRGQGPSTQQIEALNIVSNTKRVYIELDHGKDKDTIAAWLSLWFVATRYCAKVIVIAPNDILLYDIFSRELLKWFRLSKIQSEFVYQKKRLFQKDNPREWFVKLASLDEGDAVEILAGYCAEHLLIIANEAYSIPDIVFAPLDGILTSRDSKVVFLDGSL